MSIARIHQYYNELHEIKQFSGETKETSLRRPFAELLSYFAKERNLRLVDEVKIPNSTKQPDGVLIDIFRYRYGYWEAKDAKDDFEKELNQKIKIGYPTDNLLFENGQKAMLIQGSSRETCDMTDAKALLKLLQRFISFERAEAKGFRQALEIFKQEVGTIAQILKEMISPLTPEGETKTPSPNGEGEGSEVSFKKVRANFGSAYQSLLELCKTAINPNITHNEVNEMIVQHILTGDIFRHVFGDAQYHEENNIAQVLTEVEKTFFTGDLKRSTLQAIQPYYQAIKAQAAALLAHEEKQDFLKTIYENFYQAYNPKGADKLGIVYTPSEIVNFMIDGTEYLLEKYFDKTLSDKNVHILDPATGTGTFITHLIKKISPYTLKYKYEHELHANEVAILPYYIANLNIEYIYKQKMGEYLTFNNICWVDTLDNVGALQYVGKQNALFGSIAENAQRIKAQNEKRISVVIGNPPYNANQQNENDNNKNRDYKDVDKRIKDTYIKESTAQKTKQYDMYKRFIRWASDRIADNGLVCFVVNRSFIDKKQDDGFRKTIAKEFDYCYITDFGGDVRAEQAEATDNVFGIMTGVAVIILIKKEKK